MPNTKAVGVAYSDPEFESVTVTGAFTAASAAVTGAVSGTTLTASTGVRAGASSAAIAQTSAGSVNQFYATASHTSGDVRGIYARVAFTAAGAGETLRAFSTVSAAQGAGQTTNGAHISLSVNSGGTITGAANAARFTLGLAASVNPGGTLAAVQLDSDLNNTSTVPASTSFIRCTNSNSKTIDNLFHLPAAMIQSKAVADSTHLIKILGDNGTAYYLMATTTAP